MTSSTSSSEPRRGDSAAVPPGLPQPAPGPSEIAGWLVARFWLAALTALVLVGSFALVASRTPPVVPSLGPAIIDQQMARSHRPLDAELLVVGDSSGLLGLDPLAVERELGVRTEMLNVIGPVRGPGFVRLLENALAAGTRPRMVLFLIQPFTLLHPPGHSHDSLMQAVLTDRWSPIAWDEGVRRVGDLALLGGLFEEPIAGPFGAEYGNVAELRRSLDVGHGGLLHPGPPLLAPPGTHGVVDYVLYPVAREDLRQAGEMLRRLGGPPVFIGFGATAESLSFEQQPGGRRAMLDEVRGLLGLPEGRVLDLPAVLPDAEMVDPMHVGRQGRVRFTERALPALRAALDGEVSGEGGKPASVRAPDRPGLALPEGGPG